MEFVVRDVITWVLKLALLLESYDRQNGLKMEPTISAPFCTSFIIPSP